VIGAHIDVSGSNAGGNARIGGDYQGQGTVFNAQRTYVNSNSVIKADALNQGNGGRVIVWSDEATRFYGTITAQGGLLSGNGGFAEVSGKAFPDFAGTANLSAPQGQFGNLLLDPTNITIVQGGNSPSQLASLDNTINNGTLNAARANVILEASENIIINAPINISASGVGITAKANNNIEVNQDITTNGGDVNLIANFDNKDGGLLRITNATINTNDANFMGTGIGNIPSSNGITLDNSTLNAGSGNINLTGTGGVGGSNNNGVSVDNSVVQTTGPGTININGTGGNGTNGNSGVKISGNKTEISVMNGEMSIKGTGGTNATGSENDGILIDSNSLVKSLGTGKIFLEGIGGSGTDSNQGVKIGTEAGVYSVDGDIYIKGIGSPNATVYNNRGIQLRSGGTISTETGNITVEGIGGSGAEAPEWRLSHDAIRINGESGSGIFSEAGDIFLKGTGDGSGNHNVGIRIFNGAVLESSSGDITLQGKGANNAAAILLENSFINPTGSEGSGTITFTGNEIDLTGGTKIGGSGIIQLQPFDPTLDITIGDTLSDTALNLSRQELNTLREGFAQIIIGREDGSGAITQVNSYVFNGPVTLR
jgi:hypothetical protein